MNDLAYQNEQQALQLIQLIKKHVVFMFDGDGVIFDSEVVAAAVTVRNVNKHLTAHFGAGNFEPLTIEYVCNKLSGLNFDKQQIPMIEDLYGIKFSDELKQDKKAGNLAALKTETQAIHGVHALFGFIRDYSVNSIGVTQSDPERVIGTLSAPKCADIAGHLTTNLQEGLAPSSNLIPFLSAGTRIEWDGHTIEKLKSKPDPEGYNLAHQIASSRVPHLRNLPSIVFEDSDTGAKAAVAHNAAKIGIVSLGGHVTHDPHHVEKLTAIVGKDRAVVIDRSKGSDVNPWTPGLLAGLQLGLDHARVSGITNLPEKLPANVVNFVSNDLNQRLQKAYSAVDRPHPMARTSPTSGLFL